MELKLIEVVSVSSEDPAHPAEALLRREKWLSAPGSKPSHVEAVLQLSEASAIGSVHIGNCGSAFISVLVAKKGSSTFTSLLPQSSFMSVLDCKLSKNRTQVRMFNQDDFLPGAKDETWSQVKVLCSQPFNMFVQYGISFVRVFSTPGVRTNGKDASPSRLQAFKRLSSQSVAGNNARNSSPGGLLSRSERLVLQSAGTLDVPCRSPPPKRASVSPAAAAPVTCKENVVEEEDEDVFRVKAVSFLETLELHKKSLQNMELGQVTKDFETARGRPLTLEKKKIFTEILREYLKSIKRLHAEGQSYSPKNTKRSNGSQCKTPSRQRRPGETAWKDCESTPLKVVVKSCSPGWQSNVLRPDAGDREVDPMTDRTATPARCPGDHIPAGREGLSGDRRITGLSPRERRNNVSLDDVGDGGVDTPRRGTLPSPCREKLKRVLASPTPVPEFNPKRLCESPVTDDCMIVSPATRNEDSTDDLLVQCPICSKYFDASEIQSHAESCESFVGIDSEDLTVNCPLCSTKINKDEARSHADCCARKMFGD
ncbi:uncharacterized protein LOC134530522 isoform X2 [Bacillus rossius redtenbacheri]|uniref:uncharacterized protein LOC134530522 isoform X2 n=2 Tax=Bacillus rossius redtenbacheri TaxID=93214 RepID=UPI002FDECF54